MPRKVPNPPLARNDADTLSICDVARSGLLHTNSESSGHVAIYSGKTGLISDWTPVLSKIGACEGELSIAWPWLHVVRVEGRQAGDKNGRGRMVWSYVCPGIRRRCGRLVRKLYRRWSDEYSGWACATCHRLSFRDSLKGNAAIERYLRAEVNRLHAFYNRSPEENTP
jgi:hypothetical protein